MPDPSIPITDLFESELWDQVRSTAPLCSWIATMQRHGLVSTVQAEDLALRSTGPILDLVALGSCPEAPRQLLLELVFWIAPSLRSVDRREGVADRAVLGPVMWAPVQLTREKVEFQYRYDTAGVAEFGPYSASTKDCLV